MSASCRPTTVAVQVNYGPISARAAAQAEEILLRWASSEEIEDWAPEKDGEYKNPRWDMVRELKGVEEMASLPGYQAVPIIERILHARGLDLTDLGYDSTEDAVDDLEHLWDKAKMALGEAPLAAAVRLAKAHPVKFRTKRLSSKYQEFLNIAYQIQLMRGEDYIVLPVKPLARILAVSQMRVSDYRNYAKADGYLVEVGKSYWSGTGGLATKFNFRTGGGNNGTDPLSIFSSPPN